jgi:DNA repair ATPase RecN
LALFGLTLSGCRTYGGYDSKPKTYQAMQKAVQTFEEEFDQAETDLRKLETAAVEIDTLQALAVQYRDLIDEHESLLQKQQDRIERLSSSSSYRNLHVAYGATVTEQRMVQQKYQRVTRTVRAVVQEAPVQEARVKSDRRYTVRPIGFPRAEEKRPLSMEQALQGL